MSSSTTGEDDPDNGNKPSHSGTSENILELNKMILNQKGKSSLAVGGQEFQNLAQNVQGFNIFILSPSQLKDLGLVAKMKNRKPSSIMYERKDGSTSAGIAEALATSQLVPLLEAQIMSPDALVSDRLNVTDSEGHQEVVGISLKSQSPKGSAVVNENKKEQSVQCVKLSRGVKRKRFSEAAGTSQKGSDMLKNKDTSKDWSPGNSSDKDEAVSGSAAPTSMELNVQPKVKLLPKRRSFCKVHRVSWNIAIESKGYVKCLFQNCSYLALTVDEMIKHYGICNGGGDVGACPCPYTCPYCSGCVETEEKLQTHIEKSHTTEQLPSQIKVSPTNSSRNYKKDRIPLSLELMKPNISKIKADKGSSHCQDSFIITLNSSDDNEANDKNIQLVCVDNIKAEVGRTNGHEDDSGVQNVHPSKSGESSCCNIPLPVARVESCPSNKDLPEKQITSSKETFPEELSDAQEEQNVTKVQGVKEKNSENKKDTYEIVIERIENSMDFEVAVTAEKPDVSIHLVERAECTAKRELGVLCSGNTPDGSTCTMEDPFDCVSTEIDLKRHTYTKSQLFNSASFGSRQSEDIDMMTDVCAEDDSLSHSNVYHMKQCLSIYSDDSCNGGFCPQANSEAICDTGPVGNICSKQFDICKDMEQQSVKSGGGNVKRGILKTYSRRKMKSHADATVSSFSSSVQLSKSVKEMACLKKEKSDTTASHQNEQVEQSDGQVTHSTSNCPYIPCSGNNTKLSLMTESGSTSFCSVMDEEPKVDLDDVKEVENFQIGRRSESSRQRGDPSRRRGGSSRRRCEPSRRNVSSRQPVSVPEGNSEPSASSECMNTMETDVSILKDTNSRHYGQPGRRRGRSRGRGSSAWGRNSLAHQVLRKERELERSSDIDGLVKVNCAKCNEEMQKKFFERHNRMKHCGLAWIEGNDPIDFNDEKLLMRILTKVHHTRKWLSCETCGTSKRSVVGFISHLQCCQKSVEERLMLKVDCKICGRVMLPASLKVHLSTVHRNPKVEVKPVTLEETEMQSKMKRAAATKAVSLMQEFIGDEDVGEGNEKPTKHSDGLYLKVESHNISNFTRGSWKRSIKLFGKVSCRHAGCSVESKTFEETLGHYFSCPMAPKKGYSCRACSFHCENEPDMLNHVTSAHGNSPDCSENSDSDSSEENELELEDEKESLMSRPLTISSAVSRCKTHGKMKTANKMKFLSRESSGPVFGDKPYVPAVKWTLSFHLENYMQSLYPNIHSTPDDWLALTSAEAAQYLPHMKESVQISCLSMKHRVLVQPHKAVKQWNRLRLFEAQVINGTPMFFAGGPVWATAWCPIPLQEAIYHTAHMNQYLAVSCHTGMEDTHISGQSYSHSGLIQIWDFGHLDNKQPCTTPKLALGIAHDYGAVWCMEWCPSGCYDTPDIEVPNCRLRRLGLLGAACSDGTVRIFSICFPSEVQDKICDSVPIFKVEAVRTLVLDDRQTCLLGDSKWQCTRLSWYKGKGHRIIAGSFTNGMVAVWDISNESPLLSKRTGKSCIVYPYHSFQAHIGVVSAIALSPQDNGRYLMTGSFDRTTKYWDLEDTSAPITVNKRGSVTDGVWLTHWVSAVNSFDDSYSLGHANGTLSPVRHFGFSSYPLLAQNSVAWCLSTCDWMNAVAQCTLAGELTVIFSHQLLIAVDTEKGMKDKRMIISYTEVRQLEDQEAEGSECDRKAVKKLSPSQNSTGVKLSDKAVHKSGTVYVDDIMHTGAACTRPLNVGVDSSSGSIVECMDMSTLDNCDVPMAGHDSARMSGCVQDGAERDFTSPGESQDESLSVFVQSNIESKNSAMNRKFSFSVVTEDNTVTDQSRNVSVSCWTNDLSQGDFSVSGSTDTERCFSRGSSLAPGDMFKADGSMKNVMDYPEKTDGNVTSDSDREHNSDSDTDIFSKTKNRKEARTSIKFTSYDKAHKKCGLILCDFPTDNLKHMPREARLWMRQSDKMRAVDVNAYPISSINRVSWNPNCRSFLWLAAGYHCGLVRVPCMRAMYCKPIEEILQHGERKVAALLGEKSKKSCFEMS